jgi:hypothetical protein
MWKGREIGSMQLLTIGTLLQYGVALAIFFKIVVFGNSLPSHSVNSTGRRANDFSAKPFVQYGVAPIPPLVQKVAPITRNHVMNRNSVSIEVFP